MDFEGLSEQGSFVMIKKHGKILIEDNEQMKLIQQSQLNYELKMKKERKDINEKLNENENEEKNNEDKNEKEKTKLKRKKMKK